MAAGDEPRPILDLAIAVARRDHPDLDATRVRAEIDRLAGRYRALAGATPAAKADAFRRLLFDEEKFESVADLDSPRTLHIDTVLQTRRGYCLSLSIVALAVAERVGAPLHGVAAPNHFFVRYDDGAYRRNLELTRRGAAVPDAEYRARIGAGEGVYLRNLTRTGVHAYLLHNRGYVALQDKRGEHAKADFEAALRLLPGLSEAHRNLGVYWGERREWKKAKAACIEALKLYQRDVNALINLALCRRALGDLPAAISDLEMARTLAPDHARIASLLDAWRREPGKAPAAEALPAPPAVLAPGLKARYFRGTNFEQLVVERVDRKLDFDWQNDCPAAGVPRDRFSVRWEGYFKAPRTGTYTFFLVANDGSRLRIGDRTVLENWRNMGFKNWYGHEEVELKAGWHPIRVEHYDVFGGARLMLRIGLDGVATPLQPAEHLFH